MLTIIMYLYTVTTKIHYNLHPSSLFSLVCNYRTSDMREMGQHGGVGLKCVGRVAHVELVLTVGW
jgi:hypothetical protein